MAEKLGEVLHRARIIDLTYPLSPSFPLFSVYDPVRVAERFSLLNDGFFVRAWSFDEHCGTHVDAPAHFGEGADTVERISPRDLLLELSVIDIRQRVSHDHDAVVSVDDVLDWERRHGALPDRSAVLALTGWGDRVTDASAFLNLDSSGVMHTPGFSPEVADFLRSERSHVRAIGIDTPSLDIGATTNFPAHVSWLPSGRFGMENLANLDRIPPSGAFGIVGAPTFEGGSGGPCRVLALVS
jgi:kynurenine formamidase